MNNHDQDIEEDYSDLIYLTCKQCMWWLPYSEYAQEKHGKKKDHGWCSADIPEWIYKQLDMNAESDDISPDCIYADQCQCFKETEDEE